MATKARFAASFIVIVASAAAGVVACGSSGSTGKKPDAHPGSGSSVDAPGGGTDGPGSSSFTGVGEACTPGSGSGFTQGSCPSGYVCLTLQGGSGPWCSKTCTAGSGDTCNSGYTGPGLAACIFQISVGSGAASDYCGVICQDTTGTCPSNKCNSTCTSPLMCTAPLMNGSGQTVAHACQ